MAIKELSILIPTHNDLCVKLAGDLRIQAERACIVYEIIVVDDGSTDIDVIRQNSKIDQWNYCRYIRQENNIGRAAIRNRLAKEAQYEWVLFIDSDMTIVRDNYLSRYLSSDNDSVVDGGISVGGDAEELKWCLRYLYEKSAEQEHTAKMRQKNPYRDFHTANFLVRRSIMLSHPFDDRFRYYGYEDVLFGKQLREANIAITHIDNPIGFCTFESNPDFISKTEEGLQTLYRFRDELRGYSRLITIVNGIHIPLVRSFIRLLFRIFGPLIRKNLCSPRPNIRLYNIYKLGYYLSLPQ